MTQRDSRQFPPQRRRRRRGNAWILWLLSGVLVVILLALLCAIAVKDYNSYVLNTYFDEEITAEYGEQFQPPEVKAVLTGGLFSKAETKADISVSGEIDVHSLGRQELVYTGKCTTRWLFFSRDFETTFKQTVVVKDTKAPQITLVTTEDGAIYPGTSYIEEGYSAVDNVDGDVTDKVTFKQEGDQIIYTVADNQGNTATVVRDIIYKETAPLNGKVIYLTFDDGPGAETEQLLDILGKYNVKATFFVVQTNYPEVLERIAAEGHAIGVHSYSHRMDEIYKSEDAFFADVERMQELIVQYTGERTNLLRFPGGSSNTISRYNPGIMTRLAAAVEQRGYHYFDWNVDSKDAGGAKTADEVFANVIAGVESKENSVVLQHDIKDFSVEAVERIIVWGLENGYTFCSLDESSPNCHHRIFN